MGRSIVIPTRLFLLVVMLFVTLAFSATYWYKESKSQVPLTTLVKNASRSVVIIECYTRSTVQTTAGFVSSSKGHIITVAHGLTECVDKKKKSTVVVRFWEDPKKAYRARILLFNSKKDAALLQVSDIPKNIKPLRVDFSVQDGGTRIFAIGHPYAMYWSVVEGIVSADRVWTTPYRHLIQVTTMTAEGNSGGPVLTMEGKVIGVVSFYMNGNHSVGFIIPMDTFRTLVQENEHILRR